MIYRLLHYIWPYKAAFTIERIKRFVYSKWIRYEFHSCGSKCGFGGFSFLHGTKYIDLGSHVNVGKRTVWEVYDEFNVQKFTPSLSFGNDSSFGDDGHITCTNKVQIGNGVLIGRKVLITDNAHGEFERKLLDLPPNNRPITSKGPVIIEDNVWIGEMACIMPGVTIGRSAIIGANSVVTHNVPPYTLVAGNPARVIKELN